MEIQLPPDPSPNTPLTRSQLNILAGVTGPIVILVLAHAHRVDLHWIAIVLVAAQGWLLHQAYERCAIAEREESRLEGKLGEVRRLRRKFTGHRCGGDDPASE